MSKPTWLRSWTSCASAGSSSSTTAEALPGAHAFGLGLVGDVPLPGTAGRTGGSRSLTLRRAARGAVAGAWPADARDVSRRRDARGRTAWLIQAHDDAGVLLRVDTYGAYRLERGARVAQCAPPSRGPAWHWQRFVVAQVLPFAALLQGLEVLHAGAVELAGGAVGVAAPSQGGKSTLLAALVARGAPLVADDVVAAELDPGGEVVVHAGPGLLSLREGGARALGDDAQRLGAPDRRLGPWRAVPRSAATLPLRALVFLRRDPQARSVQVERGAVRAADLLGSTFNSAWRERRRVVRQMDLAAAIAAGTTLLRLTAPVSATPAALAAAVEQETAG